MKKILSLALVMAMFLPTCLVRGEPPVERLLHVSLWLSEGREDKEAADVDALRLPAIGDWFTDVWVKVPSWQEKPDAENHFLVRYARDICRDRGVRFWWGRNLWVAWPPGNLEYGEGTSRSHFEPQYFATAISNLRWESKMLGAEGFGFDAEPYGQGPATVRVRKSMEVYERRYMEWAIKGGMKAAGAPMLIYPHGSFNPKWFAWPVGELGVRGISSAVTYYAMSAEDLVTQNREPKPPEGYKFAPYYWGVWAGREGQEHAGMKVLTVEQVKSIDVGKIQETYPSVRGLFVYVQSGSMGEILKGF